MVYFPGLPDHPGHEIARRQMSGFSGMVSFVIEGGRAAVDRFFERIEPFTPAESLGGVESLSCRPYARTHSTIPAVEKQRIAITEDRIGELGAALNDYWCASPERLLRAPRKRRLTGARIHRILGTEGLEVSERTARTGGREVHRALRDPLERA
ncbi:MAG: PLP-dependent transferase [Acidobacteriota bacterium]|nr:PLP-dependent transferase [Acidobacteriota bacterium]